MEIMEESENEFQINMFRNYESNTGLNEMKTGGHEKESMRNRGSERCDTN